jgi:sortase A
MSAAAMRKGGRAFGRALQRGVFMALCIGGLALMAKGAVVPVKAVVAQVLLERAFDASVAAHRPVKPWAWADTAPVARISVERLGVRAVVLSGGSGQAMAFGPTLLPRTGRDVTIMAAHRDTHFAFIRDMAVGDVIRVEPVSGPARRYRVTGFQTVHWDRFAYPRDPARPVLALTTCWPFGATAHGPLRRVVWAEAL